MKNVLNDVLKEQSNSLCDTSQDVSVKSIIVFGSKKSHFYTELKNIKIVITNDYVLPYPTSEAGHIGLIAERGQIIPIIESPIKDKKFNPRSRVIIFEDPETEKVYGIEVDYVKKEDIVEDGTSFPQEILTIGENAYYFYDPYTFFKQSA